MTDREEFKKWYKTTNKGELSRFEIWQARGELDAVRIKELEAKLDKVKRTLFFEQRWHATIQACKEALEQPTNMVTIPLDKLEDMQRRLKRKEWQGLSDVELSLLAEEYTGADGLDVVDYGYAIEAKLREKNNA